MKSIEDLVVAGVVKDSGDKADLVVVFVVEEKQEEEVHLVAVVGEEVGVDLGVEARQKVRLVTGVEVAVFAVVVVGQGHVHWYQEDGEQLELERELEQLEQLD